MHRVAVGMTRSRGATVNPLSGRADMSRALRPDPGDIASTLSEPSAAFAVSSRGLYEPCPPSPLSLEAGRVRRGLFCISHTVRLLPCTISGVGVRLIHRSTKSDSIARIPSEAVAKWIPLEVLFTEDATKRLMAEEFQYWYTLGKVRQNRPRISAPLADVAWRVLTLATAIVEHGHTDTSYDYRIAIEAIAGGSDWGWGYTNTNDTLLLVDAANICFEIQALQRTLQGLSVRGSTG